MNEKAAALLKAFDRLPDGSRVVEIGCARFDTEIASDGWSTVYLGLAATMRGWTFNSVDNDPAAVACARMLLDAESLAGDVSVGDGAEWLSAHDKPIHGLYLDGALDPAQALKQYEAATLADGAVIAVDDVQAINAQQHGKGDLLLDRLRADGFEVEVVDTVPKGGYRMAIARSVDEVRS